MLNYEVLSARISLFVIAVCGLTFWDFYRLWPLHYSYNDPYTYMNNYAYTTFFPLFVIAGLILVGGQYIGEYKNRRK